ncbi:MAG: thiamine phosphate synthase [Gemmataceae bacterium]
MNPETHEPLPMDEPLDVRGSPEAMAVARILDANANRAREGLRVVEDYCRFVLDDATLCGALKDLRHEMTAILAQVGLFATAGLAARDTSGDVGTSLATASERQRQALADVVRANWKRWQEAARCLEEYCKLDYPEAGLRLEQLRYRGYTLEKAVTLGGAARQRLADAHLYVLLTGACCAASLDWTIQEAAAGGATIVQLREKNLSDRELLDRARNVRRWTRQAGVLFIINDRPDLARLAQADGVHLGQDDLPVREARRIVGSDALIGVSTHDLDQVRQAVLDGADYIGVGPTFPSATKDFTEFPGLEFVRQAIAATSLPAFVIGGVTLDNVADVVAAGACRVAVSQAVCQSDDPRQTAAEFARRLGYSG